MAPAARARNMITQPAFVLCAPLAIAIPFIASSTKYQRKITTRRDRSSYCRYRSCCFCGDTHLAHSCHSTFVGRGHQTYPCHFRRQRLFESNSSTRGTHSQSLQFLLPSGLQFLLLIFETGSTPISFGLFPCRFRS